MKKSLLTICLFIHLCSHSQHVKDTSFTVRGFTCLCKYNVSNTDDFRMLDRTQVAAHYPGGADDWKKFLKKNLDNKFKGRDEIQFRFEVDKNGNTGNFLMLNRAPQEKFEEAIRVIRLSGRWFPAIHGGYCVKSVVRMMVEL